MSNENETPIPEISFSVSGAASGGHIANSEYPFINKITSKDSTVAIDNPYPTDLSVSIKADSSVSGVLDFKIDLEYAMDDEENYYTDEVIGGAGIHKLHVSAQSDGLVDVYGGTLRVISYPEGPAVMVTENNGSPRWLPAPTTGKHILGREDGSWKWYPVGKCETCEGNQS